MMLENHHNIRAKIPSVFMPLVTPYLKRVENIIRPGLITLTWTSMNLHTYFASVKVVLRQLDLFIKKVSEGFLSQSNFKSL